MNLLSVWNFLKEESSVVATIVVVILTLIQITPIKINPISAIFRWLGKMLNGDLADKIGSVDKKLEKHIHESDERDLRKRRESILDFASAIANGRNYSKEQFEQMLKECDDYAQFCRDKNFINSVADESISLIKSAYSEHLRENSFLQGIYYIMPKEG